MSVMSVRPRPTLAKNLFFFAALGFLVGCGREEASAPTDDADALVPLVLQTDWLPQAEHGGFYQALAQGFYAEAGLAVEIRPGGPNSMSIQQVLTGRAHFAMNRADTLLQAAERGMPLTFVMATLRHDGQGVMVHADSPVQTLADLGDRRVKAVPGLAWVAWLEAQYDIEIGIVPHDFGMERFLADPTLAQQCLMTNEPFFVAQHGVEVRVLPLTASGFDPPHGIYANRQWLAQHPETARAFVAASIRGWQDFILGDPAPAFALIQAENAQMTPEFLAWSRQQLIDRHLITGRDAPDGSKIGHFTRAQWQALAEQLTSLGVLEAVPEIEAVADPRYLSREAGSEE